MKSIRLFTTLFLILVSHWPIKNIGSNPAPMENHMDKIAWVDSVFNELSLSEKIGQLFIVRAHTNRDQAHINSVIHQVKNLKVGGICLFQGEAEAHKKLVDTLQGLARVPLFISIDAEWGLNMRLKEYDPFPKSITLGSCSDEDLIYETGKLIGLECRNIGVNMNFAPVLDVNTNPLNPVINYRSFGENPNRVAKLGRLLSMGMMDAQVMSCGKHFPGHGNTSKDSHYDLPVVKSNIESLKKSEWIPFIEAINSGLPSVMTAHLHLPNVDSTAHLPSSLSPKIVKGLLVDSLNYSGLIITDALEMAGVRKYFNDKEISLRAFQAGNDILLLPQDIFIAIKSIKDGIKENLISEDELNRKVLKILRYKYNYARNKVDDPQNIDSLKSDLINRIAAKSISLLKNQDNLMPFKINRFHDIHLVGLSKNKIPIKSVFAQHLSRFIDFDSEEFHLTTVPLSGLEKLSNVSKDDLVIVDLQMLKQKPSAQYGMYRHLVRWLTELDKKTNLLLCYGGNPYGLKKLTDLSNIIHYSDNSETFQLAAANTLTGYLGFSGHLPVSPLEKMPAGTGYVLDGQRALEYINPLDINLSEKKLDEVDLLVESAIRSGVFPSCVVLAAEKGKVFYHKSFGYHTYGQKKKVDKHSIYDVASLTKVMGTTMALMKLDQQGKLDVSKTLGEYLPMTKGTNKEHLIIADILSHRAGLKPWIPFYENTVERVGKRRVRLKSEYYNSEAKGDFVIPVDGRHFLRKDYKDTIYQLILDSEVFEEKKYRYSDVGFYLLQSLIEQVSGVDYEYFLKNELFYPMNLQNTLFNPYLEYRPEDIPPTEYDQYFRLGEVRAYVHDMGSAMLGGVAGHAGLFSNAYDMATAFQVLLDDGKYMGRQILDSSVIAKYAHRYRGTRRGLGFDMKELQANKKPSAHKASSDRAFGHLGFTGTCVWVDPETDLVFVLLSNRTYPSMTNFKINTMDIRRRVQGIFIEALASRDTTALLE